MSRISTKDLARRLETLEERSKPSTRSKRNAPLEIAMVAMAWAWTPEEIENILIAAERQELADLPADLRRRWVEHLDRIALAKCGKTFAALLQLEAAEVDTQHVPPAGHLAQGRTSQCR